MAPNKFNLKMRVELKNMVFSYYYFILLLFSNNDNT